MNKTQAYLTLVTMMLISMMSTIGIALPYPILAPLFLAEPVSGLTSFFALPQKVLLAIMLAVYPFGLLIGSIFIGALSDHYGRRRTLLVSLVFSALGYTASILAILSDNYLFFLFSRFLTGIFEGNMAIARAIAADLHPTISRTRAFAWIYSSSYAGWFIGPLVGGYLMVFSTYAAFAVALVTISISALFVMMFVKETHAHPLSSKQNMRFGQALVTHNALRLLAKPHFRSVFYLYFLITLGLNAFYEFYPPWLVESFRFDSVQIGHQTALLTGFMLIGSLFLVEFFGNRFGKKATILTSLLSLSSLLICAPFIQSNWSIVYFAAIGVCIALYNSQLPAYLSQTFSEQGQGQLMGLLTSTFFLSSCLIALIGAGVSLIANVIVLSLGGVFMLVGALSLAYFMRTEINNPVITSSVEQLNSLNFCFCTKVFRSLIRS